MNSYSIEINFETDKPLTDFQLGLLYSQVLAQVEEPTDEEGNNASYEVLSITKYLPIKVKENK
jgi:hypothetical protein